MRPLATKKLDRIEAASAVSRASLRAAVRGVREDARWDGFQEGYAYALRDVARMLRNGRNVADLVAWAEKDAAEREALVAKDAAKEEGR